ncbi:dihydropteroate synthase [Brevibacterium jeotgali]|uniref:Dihydropteroate synthase n=1 Tax=Brevibacterium jeotgali TaxID=1262550 RepID=A0A2H1L840_9MICO|nr:dihydropteroate synthase [Brevibacterium jeotgali]TWC03296.1 dihydropteroate synthase [Brevibacterium jeotgali]SMY12955.1 dihydropteroate synthase [Brevibacterium jeotgali]
MRHDQTRAGPGGPGASAAPDAVLRIGRLTAGPGRPVVMAVINRSIDSFYTAAPTTEAAVRAAADAHAAGARIVDIGGVRAGRGPRVGVEEEIGRICPVIEAIREEIPDLVISADTYRAPVARAAVAVGADIVNDTWAGADPDLPFVAAEAGAGLVCSHTGGLDPRTDAHRSRYGLLPEDVVDDALDGVLTLAERARSVGVPPERILLDPTPDFGKNTRHSLSVLKHIGAFADHGMPVLLAISRKDFIGESVDADVPEQRLPATLAATAYAVEHGVAVIRAHDAVATVQVVDMIGAILGTAQPRRSVRGLR